MVYSLKKSRNAYRTYVRSSIWLWHISRHVLWLKICEQQEPREMNVLVLKKIAISFRSGPLVHVHVHFRELKIGSLVIGMLQSLSACYMVCNALILFGCFYKELHEALSSKLHQWLHAALAAWCAICIKYLRHTS